MPRTIHVTVTYSVHILDDKMSDRKALMNAKENFDRADAIFDVQAKIFDRWKDEKKKPRRGFGSY